MMSDTSGVPFMVDFEATESCRRYQDALVRFGHSDNITRAYETINAEINASESSDYVLGLIFLGALITAFFLVWSILLTVFMCIGYRVGFLSGAAFTRLRKEQPDESIVVHDESYIQNEYDIPLPQTPEERFHAKQAFQSSFVGSPTSVASPTKPKNYDGDPWCSRPTLSRIVFILSGLICITFGVLMVTQGITDLQTSINVVDQNANDLATLSDSVKVVIRDALLELSDTAQRLRNILNEEMGDLAKFCPEDPSMEGSETAKSMKESRTTVLDMLAKLDNFRKSNLDDLDAAMQVLYDGSSEIATKTDNYDVNDWPSLIVLIPYTVFPAILIVAALMASHDVSIPHYNCFINWFVLPIFILMTIVAVAFSVTMSIMAGVNSDFCLPGGMSEDNNSPDDLILSIMEIEGYDQTSYTHRVGQFYVKQCRNSVDDPLVNIREYGPELTDNVKQIKNLISDFLDDAKIDELAVYCNRNYDVFSPLLMSMGYLLESLIKSVASLLDIIKCARLIPLYTHTVYKAGCQYAPSAVFWVFFCCLVLACFGMIMITLRSSMKPSVLELDYKNHFLISASFQPQERSGSFQRQSNIVTGKDDVSSDLVQEVPRPSSPKFVSEEHENEEDNDIPVEPDDVPK